MELVYIKNDPDRKKVRYKIYDCPHNDGCRCTKMECWQCGWNPSVADRRMERILRKLGVEAL